VSKVKSAEHREQERAGTARQRIDRRRWLVTGEWLRKHRDVKVVKHHERATEATEMEPIQNAKTGKPIDAV
jgi:hypothetical protein